MIYCLSCKKKTPDNNLTAKITKNKNHIFNQTVLFVKN